MSFGGDCGPRAGIVWPTLYYIPVKILMDAFFNYVRVFAIANPSACSLSSAVA